MHRGGRPPSRNMSCPRQALTKAQIAMGDCHARKARQWVSTLGPVFQVRLGNRRLIYANTFDSVKDLWIGEQAALISRPLTYTFHQIVSTTQGFTLGTSPWNDGVKRARKAAATALNRIATQSYLPIIDLESTNSINEMLTNCVNPETQKTDLDPNGYFQRFSLNISLTLNYGIRIDGNIHDKILNEAVHCERELGNLRSVSHNWQDYIPLLRLLPQHTAKEYRGRRDAYINHFLSQLKERMANGTDIPCIAGNIIKDPEAKMTDKEIKTICITMVAAGLDTLPGNINMTTAFLGSAEGQRVQQKAYSEIMATYPDGDAWDKVLQEEAVPYMSSLVSIDPSILPSAQQNLSPGTYLLGVPLLVTTANKHHHYRSKNPSATGPTSPSPSRARASKTSSTTAPPSPRARPSSSILTPRTTTNPTSPTQTPSSPSVSSTSTRRASALYTTATARAAGCARATISRIGSCTPFSRG